MEQELNKYETLETDTFHFKILHKNQNIKGNEEYQKWLENAKEHIKSKNKDRFNEPFYLIDFCDNCCSYAIFKSNLFCFIICQNCKHKFCIGCGREPLSDRDYSACLKGFLKINYLRFSHERIGIIYNDIILVHFHMIFSLFFTPLYIGFIFNMLGFLSHQRKSRMNVNGFINDFIDSLCKLLTIFIFSIIKGFLFFPYMLLFFPIMCLILLPWLFFRRYYLKIFNFYFTIIKAGATAVKQKYW